MSTSPQAGVYVLGAMTDHPQATTQALLASSFDYIVLASMHVSSTGDINFNNTPISSLNPAIPDCIQQLKHAGKRIYASFGGGGVFQGHAIGYWDFSHIQALFGQYPPPQDNDQNPFLKNLDSMFRTLHIDGFDNDLESYVGYSQFKDTCAAINSWLFSKGYAATIVPYEAQPFWTTVLEAAVDNNTGQQQVSFANVQNAVPGASSWVTGWQNVADQIGMEKDQVPGFVSAGLQIQYMSPSEVESAFKQVAGQGLMGGWLWNYDDFMAGHSAADYADAVKNGMSGG